MANDAQQQDRTEQATPKKREDARRKGDVPRSRELTMASVMISGAAGLILMAEPMGGRIAELMIGTLSIDRADIFRPDFMTTSFAATLGDALLGLLPLGAVLIVAAMGGAALIGGWSFSTSALAFKGERINPLKGIKRIFSPNALNELVKALAKFILVGAAALLWLWICRGKVMQLGRLPIDAAIIEALSLCGVSLLIVSATLILIAAADVPFQLWSYSRKLRMTRQEVRDEFKDTEGRPEVKARLRAMQQEVATRRMMEDVPTADVVITNPTHFAVALKYEDGAMSAPRVIAKGQDLIAARIRELATENDVPLFSAPPLARALYTAVAQVLAYIFQIRDLVPGVALDKPDIVDIDEQQFK